MIYTPETREERLRRIRRQIDAGDYETPDRLRVAVERLWEEMQTNDDSRDAMRVDWQGSEPL